VSGLRGKGLHRRDSRVGTLKLSFDLGVKTRSESRENKRITAFTIFGQQSRIYSFVLQGRPTQQYARYAERRVTPRDSSNDQPPLPLSSPHHALEPIRHLTCDQSARTLVISTHGPPQNFLHQNSVLFSPLLFFFFFFLIHKTTTLHIHSTHLYSIGLFWRGKWREEECLRLLTPVF